MAAVSARRLRRAAAASSVWYAARRVAVRVDRDLLEQILRRLDPQTTRPA